jgi:AcrR family transcriptional regulator
MNINRSQNGLKVVRRKHGRATPDPTREKLLEAAGPVFANRGYQAAKIREICEGAGGNVAAINYHFGDKLGLYTEVLQQSVRAAQVLAVHNTLDPNTPPASVLGKQREICALSAAQPGFLDAGGLAWAAFRAERTAWLPSSAKSSRKHPAATRIGGSYGESRFKCIFRHSIWGMRAEMSSVAMLRWADKRHLKLHFIAPGKPVQNAFIESLNEHDFRSLQHRTAARLTRLEDTRGIRCDVHDYPTQRNSLVILGGPRRAIRFRLPVHRTPVDDGGAARQRGRQFKGSTSLGRARVVVD